MDLIAVRAFPKFIDWQEDRQDKVLAAFTKYATVPVINMEKQTITFSDETLMKILPITEGITLGALKQKWSLECEYSAELTEAQIEKMNSKVFYPVDWALVSLKAFDSEEYMTVTMKSGERFRIQVTDAQISRDFITASGETYTITIIYDEDAGIPEEAELLFLPLHIFLMYLLGLLH